MAKRPLDICYKILSQDLYNVDKSLKVCLFQNSDCKYPIKKAHSIAISALKKIANENSKVYINKIQSYSDFKNIHDYSSFVPKEVTISKFSTFYGFCDYHDSALFQEIENKPIIPTLTQVKRYWLRTVAANYYYKINGVKSLNVLKNAEMPYEIDTLLPNFQNYYYSLAKVKADLFLELKYIKNNLLTDKNDLNYIFIRVDTTPEIMCCDNIIPEYDFYGNPIKNPVNGVVEDICINISVDNKSGYILLSWKKDYSGASIFIDSLLSSRNITSTLLAFIFYKLTKYAFSIKWWDKLSITKKKILMTYYSFNHDKKCSYSDIMRLFYTDYHKYLSCSVTNVIKSY